MEWDNSFLLILLAAKRVLTSWLLGTGTSQAWVHHCFNWWNNALFENVEFVVTKVKQLIGFPEMLDGRVKTLHPSIHGEIEDKQVSGSIGDSIFQIHNL